MNSCPFDLQIADLEWSRWALQNAPICIPIFPVGGQISVGEVGSNFWWGKVAAGRKTLNNQLIFGPQPHNENLSHIWVSRPGLGTRRAWHQPFLILWGRPPATIWHPRQAGSWCLDSLGNINHIKLLFEGWIGLILEVVGNQAERC